MGLDKDASTDDIKHTYRRLAMQYHPDHNVNDPDCEEKLKEINEAYHVLGNAEKKWVYDHFYLRIKNIDILSSGFNKNRFSVSKKTFCHGKRFKARKTCQRWK